MLTIKLQQLERLDRLREVAFARRVDEFLCEQLGAAWHQGDSAARLERVRAGCDVGRQLGIVTDLHLAQFALLHLMRGDSLLEHPQGRQIVQDQRMDWRQKLFQLTALAGVDLGEDHWEA